MSNRNFGVILLSGILALTAVPSALAQPNQQRRDEIRGLQSALLSLGFDPGPIDGIMGPLTWKAIREFQQHQNLLTWRELDARTRAAMNDESVTPAPAVPQQTPGDTRLYDYFDYYDYYREWPTVPPRLDPWIPTPGTLRSMGIGSGSVVEDIRQVQIALKNRGYDPGGFTGSIDWQTQQALMDFQAANNLPVTGILDQRTQAALGVAVRGTTNP